MQDDVECIRARDGDLTYLLRDDTLGSQYPATFFRRIVVTLAACLFLCPVQSLQNLPLMQMLPGKYPRALALTADGVAHLVDIKEVRTWCDGLLKHSRISISPGLSSYCVLRLSTAERACATASTGTLSAAVSTAPSVCAHNRVRYSRTSPRVPLLIHVT